MPAFQPERTSGHSGIVSIQGAQPGFLAAFFFAYSVSDALLTVGLPFATVEL